MYFVVEREKRPKQNDNWNFWICVFWSKNGRFVTHNCFSKKAETPIFIVFGGGRFLGQVIKKGNFWTPPPQKKKKILTDNWKLFFWYLCAFLLFLYFFSVCLFFFVFWAYFRGFKSQVRWPEGPPHLALNPPYLFFVFLAFLFFCFFCVFLEGLRVRWGGPKGHLTCP